VRPGGARIGAPPPAGGLAVPEPAGGFFDTHRVVPNPTFGPAYITDLPRPLNQVTPRPGQWFELGDGTLVKGADEIERLHAEHQRLMQGEEDPEPPSRVHSADRFRDGSIPSLAQLERDQREYDATCHPYGGWERDPSYPTNSERSRRYETQITRAPGLDYVVRNPGERPVKFDGCAVWDPKPSFSKLKAPATQVSRKARADHLASAVSTRERKPRKIAKRRRLADGLSNGMWPSRRQFRSLPAFLRRIRRYACGTHPPNEPMCRS